MTRIKQECLETDFHDSTSSQMKIDSPRRNEPVKNVKCEVDETDVETESILQDCASPDIIQIISEEIVNHHQYDDIKQPHIEIISENFVDDFKGRDFNEIENNNLCDIKNNYFNLENQEIDQNDPENDFSRLEDHERAVDPTTFIEVKMQVTENDYEQLKTKKIKKTDAKKKLNKVGAKKKKKKPDLVESDAEIDDKFFLLGENEVCEVDMEEMEAIIKKKSDPNASFNCDKCGKKFKFFKCLRKHRDLHNSEPETFICDFCNDGKNKNFEFSSLKCLKSHMKRKHLLHEKGKFPCSICNKILPSQGQLNSHNKKVHDNSGATCQICGKGFKNK